jgi:hypothetical protein
MSYRLVNPSAGTGVLYFLAYNLLGSHRVYPDGGGADVKQLAIDSIRRNKSCGRFNNREKGMKKHVSIAVIVSFVSMSLQGCAAMFHGTTQQVAIRSNVPGTDLFVNEAYVGRDNGVTTFHKDKDYTITARKAGCTDTSAPASKSFDAVTLLGIFIDLGIITILLIDGVATGAWQQFDQTSYVIDPHCAK